VTDPTVIRVQTAAPYDVVVGRDLLDRLPELIGATVSRVALVHAEDLLAPAAHVTKVLEPAYDVVPLPVPPGERGKTADVAAGCWESLGAAGFTRSDAVVAVGGGATTDLAGFVAATWLRGVRVVHVPTTLLGMVDAAVGGKTGINTTAGKNLVGAFHEPAGVLCDLDLLATLPEPELRSGLGEVVKCGFIADPEILGIVEAARPGELTAGSPVLRELVERAVRVKADVVVDDLRESGGREGGPGREVLAELARAAGVLDDAVVDRHRSTFARVGLPTGWAGASYADLRARMAVDKKSRGSSLRFVVLDDVARPRVLTDPDEAHLRAAYDVMAGGPR
jgi:3-dehydroquinate synthase